MEGEHSFGNLVTSALLNQCAVTVHSPAHELFQCRPAARRLGLLLVRARVRVKLGLGQVSA